MQQPCVKSGGVQLVDWRRPRPDPDLQALTIFRFPFYLLKIV